ncbi:MAG: prepilin-type N-terminal cleavage/methylation domain-containing protein [Caldilineaceae bacterium]|nr:prepilin-type N-terminal cleavage/methylation domain-containing protein [Caldilineaceae bacterium]MCB1105332.1 prepilin-type N-terminal cleavage/methylation domain-containing protein [Cephaloticoccus sp.]MCP5529671.1 prepilin-type N-terminal cleavage/methylation domain-containing protein [Opitutaceae bacterium]
MLFRRTRKTPSGFTIVEVMVAATIMVLGITTSLTTLTFGMRAIDTARNSTLAAQIMQSEMENIRLLNWAQLTALSTSETVDISSIISSGSSTTLDATLNNIISKFTCTRTITTPKSNMREITLTVSWNGQDGRAHSNSYVTRYCKDGLYDFYYTAH